MLVVDLETEVMMNGITDFIGNNTGLYAVQTVHALEVIGCQDDASLLRQILASAGDAGMTHEAIQAERSGVAPFTVTSFSAVHGGKWDAVSEKIDRLCGQMDFERIQARAVEFVADHEGLFRATVGR
jgi:hypothetical protein